MDLPSAIDVVRPAVVQIRVDPEYPKPGVEGQVIGTGFWVHPDGLILTAKHVTEGALEAVDANPGARIRVGMAIPTLTGPPVTIRGSFEVVDASVIEEDPRHDLALLQAVPNPLSSGRPSGVHQVPGGTAVNALYGLAAISNRPVRDGESIGVSGYPLAEPALVTTSGEIASAFGTDIQQVQAPGGPTGFTIPNVADSYLADVAVNPGNSGGPAYRVEDASVLGVVVAFKIGTGQAAASPFFYNSGLSVVVPIKYGEDLIARHT